MTSDVHQIISQVYRAKKDSHAADELISAYMPFIKSETSKFLNRPPDQSDDELSIAMFAFYEAIKNYLENPTNTFTFYGWDEQMMHKKF